MTLEKALLQPASDDNTTVRMYTIREIVQMLSTWKSTVRRWMTVGVDGRILPSFKIGKRRMVRADDLAAFIRGPETRDIG